MLSNDPIIPPLVLESAYHGGYEIDQSLGGLPVEMTMDPRGVTPDDFLVPSGDDQDDSSSLQEERFKHLADEWRRDTSHLSVDSQRAAHFSYHQIIGMGRDAIPFMYRDLQRGRGSDWFWALHAITGALPKLSADDFGRARRIAKAWIELLRERGYVR